MVMIIPLIIFLGFAVSGWQIGRLAGRRYAELADLNRRLASGEIVGLRGQLTFNFLGRRFHHAGSR